jgi:ubiquinol-cytochrome c reductase cytochrome b subunit
MAITWYILLWISGGNDIMATVLHLSINDITMSLRLLIFVLPPLVFWLTKRTCLGLQRKDREKVLHGRETGTVMRTATGEYFEVHEPLDEYSRWTLVQHETNAPMPELTTEDSHGVRRPGGVSGWKRKLSRFYFEERVAPVSPAELTAAHHDHHGHEAIEASSTSAH